METRVIDWSSDVAWNAGVRDLFQSYQRGESEFEPSGFAVLSRSGWAVNRSERWQAAGRLLIAQGRLRRIIEVKCRVCGDWFKPLSEHKRVRCPECRKRG